MVQATGDTVDASDKKGHPYFIKMHHRVEN